MGCGGSKSNAVEPTLLVNNTISKDVAISQFKENEEEDVTDDLKYEDFFTKVKNAQIAQDGEQSQLNIRDKRKHRELKQSGFLKKLVADDADDIEEDQDEGNDQEDELDELDKAESDAKGNDKGKNKAESEDSDDESD